MGYKKPKTIVLTPSRKHLGKAVAHKRKMVVARECCKDSGTLKYIIAILGSKMRKEIHTMCSDNTKSFLQSQSKEKLTTGLSWDQLHSELSKNAPTLLSFLQACTKTRVARPNTKAVVGVCAAIILKHRQPKMNLLQKIISLILYAGHASKKVISSNVTITFVLVYYLCTVYACSWCRFTLDCTS